MQPLFQMYSHMVAVLK